MGWEVCRGLLGMIATWNQTQDPLINMTKLDASLTHSHTHSSDANGEDYITFHATPNPFLLNKICLIQKFSVCVSDRLVGGVFCRTYSSPWSSRESVLWLLVDPGSVLLAYTPMGHAMWVVLISELNHSIRFSGVYCLYNVLFLSLKKLWLTCFVLQYWVIVRKYTWISNIIIIRSAMP